MRPKAALTLRVLSGMSDQPRLGFIFEAKALAIELESSGIDSPFVGVIDLIAELNTRKNVTDFKTSASSYAEHESKLSDQLTASRQLGNVPRIELPSSAHLHGSPGCRRPVRCAAILRSQRTRIRDGR